MTRSAISHALPNCPLCGSKRTKARFFLPGGGVVNRCRDCTVEFLSPQPDDTRLNQIYSESYYAAWGLSGQQDNDATRSMKRATFRLRLNLIRRHLQPAAASATNSPAATSSARQSSPDPATRPRILDVGCATGYFLELAEEEGFQPFGVEYSAYAAARASLRFGAGAIFQGTLEQSSFPAASFSAIAMSDLLEHVRSPLTTLTCAETLLTPGGILLIMTPDTSSRSRWLMGHRWTHYKPEHLFYFNRRCLTWLANRAGLRLTHFERSKKALNLAYLYTQFSVYRHWLLTPLVTLAHRLAPNGLRNRNFYFSIGEMVVILEKKA
ncbi:class I SAM-dependent methyltransferase [Puia sp.]|uniref:class I SAM-dependent methyltransferase n=1 Tax=Puia sp. TaxID=2045100 RepID=UPI002F3F29AA